MPISFDIREVVIEVELHQITCDTCGTIYKNMWCGENCTGEWHDEDCHGAERAGWVIDYLNGEAYCPQCKAQGRTGGKDNEQFVCDNCRKEEYLERGKAEYYGWQITTDEIYGRPPIVNTLCPECAKKQNKENH